jgi:pyridoxine kinase
MRVLSIQSWVVHGYVGNKCSVFALQLHGFDVDAINTVNLSNHTGYPVWRGEVMSGEQLTTIFDGLTQNGLLHGYTHLLTGYVRTAACLEHIVHIHTTLKALNPELIFVCDPVMGDEGKLYVPAENVAVFRDRLVPRADFCFPNQTEAELLTDMRITDRASAIRCMDDLHRRGPRLVIIKSSTIAETADTILLVGSWQHRDAATGAVVRAERFQMLIPRIDGYYTGTGDLFAALMIAWMWRENARGENASAGSACQSVVGALLAVLRRTKAFGATRPANAVPRTPELQLIQSAQDLVSPRWTVAASELEE